MLQPRSFLFSRASTPKSTHDTSYDGHRKERRSASAHDTKHNTMSLTTSSTASTTTITETDSRPTTPSSPVIIPIRGAKPHDSTHERQKGHGRKDRSNEKTRAQRAGRRPQPVHSPDAIPPSVAALLALTSIPLQKKNSVRSSRPSEGQRLTVDAIMRHTGEAAERELGMSLGRSPLDILLSPPDEDDEIAESENGQESIISTRTMSSESMPSLDGDCISETSPSLRSIMTPRSASQGRKTLGLRRLRSRTSSQCLSEEHPLSSAEVDVDELDLTIFLKSPPRSEQTPHPEMPSPQNRSAFKSNLTASLRALRAAAMSFSSLKPPLTAPDDFLTRSIISIDPHVPYVDERMPPRLEDTPTPALRRYLNPTTNAPIEAHVPPSLAQTMGATKCTASIQMQTYKVSRSAKSTSPSVISRRTRSISEDALAEVAAGPLARQRDMRENSDFIRVAVMEMLMRKKGKLDDQKPGRARWALPPRKPPTRPYEISENGVPIRWIATVN